MDVDSDIYENLPNTDNNDLYEELEKLRQQNNLLQELINSLEGDIEKLCGRITEMKKIQDNLSKNISELFKTAKAELERKDRIIAELRAQLDSFLQRKKSNFSMKRERDKSPSVGKLPLEHVAKKMRHEEDNRVKRTYFKRSRSRSRSSERSRRLHNDRRDRFDRHKHDYDSRRINVSSRDEKSMARGFKSKNYINREHDKKEIIRRDTTEVKKPTEMNIKDVEEKKKVEELTKKRDFDKREVIIIIDRDDNIKTSHENAKIDKESVQNDLKEVTKVKSRDMVEGERNGTAIQQEEMDKASNSVKDLKVVTEEVKRKRGLDQKKIVVKRNAKGMLIKSHVVKVPNSICNKQESKDDEEKISDTSKTLLYKQNEDLATNKEKSGVKVNTTIIVETANKLKERLEEEAKQATPVTLQFADFAKVGGDSVEVTKSKIVEVTRKLFEDSEDEALEVPRHTMDMAESCKKSVAKGVAGVKIEAVSKKLLGRLEEAKCDLQKTKGDDFREVASQKNKDEVKTKNEVFMELFGSIEEDDETVAHEKATHVDKTEEVLKKPVGRSSQEEDNQTNEISEKLCEESASFGQAVTISEKIPNIEGTNVDKNKIDSSLKRRLDEEEKEPIQGCVKLDDVNEVDYETEDKMKQMKIEEMSKNLFRQIVEEAENDKQKTTIIVENENEEQKIIENKSEEVVNRSKSGDLCVNLAESIKNSIDFTKKRHDMMYGEVSKEISLLVPQCMDNNVLHKEKMTEDKKERVNSKHSVKSQKTDRQRRKSESSKLTKNGEKSKQLEEKNSISSVQNKDYKKKDEGKSSKHQKIDKWKKKHEYSKLTKDEKIIREGRPVDKEKRRKFSIQNEDNKNTNREKKEKKKSESAKVAIDDKIGKGQTAHFNEQKIDKEKEGKYSVQNEDTKKSEKDVKIQEKQLDALNSHKTSKEKESVSSIQNEDDKNINKEESYEIVSKHQKIDKRKRKSESSKVVKDDKNALLNDEQIHKEKKNVSLIQNEDTKNSEFLELAKDGKIVEEQLDALNDQKRNNEKKRISSIQNGNDKNTDKEESYEIVSKHQKIDKVKRKSVSSKVVKDDEKVLSDQQIDKEKKNISSVQNNKSEVSSKNDKPKSPKKSSPKDSKPKKTKENVKNKDDDSSGSFIEESDRVLRSTTRRNSRLQEETQKKEKKSETKLDLNPHVELSDFTTVNLSHDGEIPVLHIAEDSHLVGNSTLLNLENCQPVITSSPIKSDSLVSFNLSGSNGSNSFGETRIFNISSGKKRRRIILKMVD